MTANSPLKNQPRRVSRRRARADGVSTAGLKRIVVTDRSRLGKLLVGPDARAQASTRLLALLEASLESALEVDPAAVPRGLVTMNSQVRLVDLESGEEMACSVVYPEDVEFVANGVSVFEPLGISLIGHNEGDSWKKWNAVMRDQLVKSQATKGHEAGSWQIDTGHGSKGGRLYSTSMATMILEVYYRHLPIYRKQSAETDFPLD